VVAYGYSLIIAINAAPAIPAAIVSVIPPKPCIRTSVVVAIRPVPGVAHRVVESSVRTVVHQTESYSRSNKKPVERSVYIVPVIVVDETSMVLVYAKVVIKYPHTSNSSYTTIAIPDINISNLGYPTVIIVIDRHIFNLDYSSIIVILNKRVVVITRVKG